MVELSVIIPTRNRVQNLELTLVALTRQSLPTDRWELIISDDNSTDGTYNLVEYYKSKFNLRYIFNNHKKGSWNAATPRNLGAFISDPESKALVFVDSDVILPAGALEWYLEDLTFNQNRVIIGSYHWLRPMDKEEAKTHILNQEHFTSFFEQRLHEKDVRTQKFDTVNRENLFCTLQDGLACFGGNLCVPRNIFFQVGGYDDDTHIGLEDGEMGIRVWKKQIPFSYDKRTLGYHQFHQVPADRFPPNMKEYIDKLNQKHFKTDDPDFDLITATKEAFFQWGFHNWQVPEEWTK